MRKKKEISIDLNSIRAKFYASHFEARQMARNHPERENIARLVASLPKAELTVYGAPGFEGKIDAMWPIQSIYMLPRYELAARIKVEPISLYTWYWSDEGWAEFEKLWRNLPENVHMLLCTNQRVIHISTQETYCDPAGQP